MKLMIDLLNIEPHQVSTDLKGYAICIYGGPGLGKAQPNSSIIPTFGGSKQMGDIKIGDYVFNRLGEPVKVLGVYPQGFKDIYKITFADGRTAFSCEEHLWTYVTSRKNFKTVPLKEIIEQGVRRVNGTKYKYNIPVASPLQYAEKEFPVDPYVVGAFLGDGSLTLRHLTLSSNDAFIPNRIAEILGCETEKTSDKNFNWVFFRGKHENGSRKLIHTHEIFSDLPEVTGNSFEKTIPAEYFEGSIDQRFALLQGLMDTDGSITMQKGKITFSSVNYELAQGVVDLARSLGFVVSVRQYERNDKVSVEFNVQIQGLKNIERVFSLPRKKNLVTKYLETPTKKFARDTISIRNIEYSHKEEATCIFVDDLEHLYVTENYVVTHNTTTALQGDKTLLIAAEKGYKTIPNTMAVDINSWSDVLTTVAQLRKPEVQELYDTIVIDTLDEFAFYAEQFVLQQNAASKPSDIPYGGFYVQIEQVFRKIFRDITQHYGLIIVAHADIKKDEESDQEDDLFYATLAINKRVKKVVVGLVDLLIFVEGDRSKPGVTIAHYLSSPKWEAKSRFPNIVPSNILSYENIVIDINDAIGGVATAKKSRQYITDAPVIDAGDFQKLKEKVDALGMNLVQTRGLSVVQDAINSILGKRITDSDIGDAAALQALLAEFESLS